MYSVVMESVSKINRLQLFICESRTRSLIMRWWLTKMVRLQLSTGWTFFQISTKTSLLNLWCCTSLPSAHLDFAGVQQTVSSGNTFTLRLSMSSGINVLVELNECRQEEAKIYFCGSHKRPRNVNLLQLRFYGLLVSSRHFESSNILEVWCRFC